MTTLGRFVAVSTELDGDEILVTVSTGNGEAGEDWKVLYRRTHKHDVSLDVMGFQEQAPEGAQ